MERYICIHGHFYQPPRENPSLEAIELQDSAYPYHDWNERITAECYGPNGASRILDDAGHIVRIANNYAKMSFNFGPTLLAWMELNAPEVYQTILAADAESQENFSGHGSALAQVYNHVIMPLANRRDKRTQVIWGIRDFEHRYGRFPEGMWLPETAVDLATLDTLAELGIKFTILAPHQASRVRKMGDRAWVDVSGGRIDPTRAYSLRLPSGRKINLFFYDGPVSNAVAFGGLLNKGEHLAGRLIDAFSDARSWPQLVHIATDGETYGHHHRHGDMALAYALHHIEANNMARLTNYGEYLEKHPPAYEVEIFENTSWSCVHGIERWRSDCGCNSGSHQGWNQSWRGPLREALDWLRDTLSSLCADREREASLFKDIWAARNEYISLILNRSSENVEAFLSRHAARPLNEIEKVRALKLMEIQRQAVLMYTSCGWFFDDVSGIETAQVIQYAGRALQLAEDVFGESLERRFLELIERAKSNVPRYRDGRQIYEKWVKPGLTDLKQVGAHYAMSSLFENYGDRTKIYCYSVERKDYKVLSAGKVRLALGKARIVSEITHEAEEISFGVLHLGDHNLSGGVREFRGEESHKALVRRVSEAFARADVTELIRVMDKNFGANSYSLKVLFRDEQRKILRTILDSTLRDAEAVYRQVYEHHAPMMRFLAGVNAPPPKAWHAAAELVINSNLHRAFESEDMDIESVTALVDEARMWQVSLDREGLGYVLRRTIERMAEQLRMGQGDLSLLQKLEKSVDLAHSLPFEVDLWRVQNIYYETLLSVYARSDSSSQQASETAQAWLNRLTLLGEKLGIRVAEVMKMKDKQIRKAADIVVAAEEIAAQRRVPCATYRLQFSRAFTFQDARALVPYLYELGISDCYTSPILRPRSDSDHGYDICDHSQLNPALGTEEDFDAFSASLQERGMGLILDNVPNHMGIADAANTWWMDVLENGPSSVYSTYFDIDWHPAKLELQNKVLLPILEDQYGKVLESGKFRLTYEDGTFFVRYYRIKLPLAPRTYSSILSYQLGTLVQALGEDNEHVRELQSIITALNHLPLQTETSPEKIAERVREKEIIKGRIAALYQASAYVRAAIDSAVQAFNGAPGDRRSFDMLDELLGAQAYRPAFWRVAAEEINYRRFFDINELAAIRVELPEVFPSTHQLVLRLLAEGKVTGLRIDHPDGLWNPEEYFYLLQENYVINRVLAQLGAKVSPDEVKSEVSRWLADRSNGGKGSKRPWPLYVVAEKILSEGESLPASWAVDGTTGYDFLNSVNGLFVDSSNRKAFDKIYNRFAGNEVSFGNLTNSTKKMIMLVSLVSEINSLGRRLERIAEKNRLYRDFTLNSLTFAIREVIAALPVYRTYVTGPDGVRPQDKAYLEAAVAEAKKRNPRTAAAVFDFIRDTLLLRNVQDFAAEDQRTLVDMVMKFQQVTGPVMAKGVEDTAFYVYNRLLSLNEVGGNPVQFGNSVAAFHRRNAERQQRWPHSLLATSTHDTKRGEDVRARIDVLSEIPTEFRTALSRWTRLNASKKLRVDGELAPDRNDEYLLYQTLLGTWPDGRLTSEELAQYRERIAAYMQKATKEAKVRTSWVNPNEQYDAAVQHFVRRILSDRDDDPFIKSLLSLQRRVAYYGRFNSLSQVLLKLTSPGVPDIYQGTELWDYSLVDPDNRRQVDYRRRESLLAELKSRAGDGGAKLVALAHELLENSQDGRIKLYVTYRALHFRRAHHRLFANGEYVPLEVHADKREHICAFARTLDGEAALIVVPRLVVRLMGGVEQPPLGSEVWRKTWLGLPQELVGKRYCNVFTGELLSVEEQDGTAGLPAAAIFAHFPVALLEQTS